jgi:hypothetical protein
MGRQDALHVSLTKVITSRLWIATQEATPATEKLPSFIVTNEAKLPNV